MKFTISRSKTVQKRINGLNYFSQLSNLHYFITSRPPANKHHNITDQITKSTKPTTHTHTHAAIPRKKQYKGRK